MERAMPMGMKNLNWFTILFVFFLPAGLLADDTQSEGNVNERYVVESVAFSGTDLNRIDENMHDEAQKMVGEKYSEKSAQKFARKLRKKLGNYKVDVRVERGEKPDHVKVVFQIEHVKEHFFGAEFPLIVYHSKQGISVNLELSLGRSTNVFTFGLTNDADQLLERNAGLRLRYEHRKLGTNRLQFRMDFDSYHQKFNPATETNLVPRQDVPGIYRNRQNFAPSLSLLPVQGLKLSAGVSFQRLQMQYPELRTETAYAGTGDIQFQRTFAPDSKHPQSIEAAYSLRTATRVLESDFVYTRHFVRADYALSSGKSYFRARFLGGSIDGVPPLFERFSLGNTTTLRGWNKFDVAPLGGTRVAHGSLEYHYGEFQIFYDVGTVWDADQYMPVRHGLGFGWASKPKIFGSKFFVSLAFPIRLHDVVPVFMMGIRY